MEILNYTGKPISVKLDYDAERIIYPDGEAQLMSEPKEKVRVTTDNIPIYVKQYGRVMNLPKEDHNKDVMYIVDIEIANAVGNSRNDLLVMKNPNLVKDRVYNDGLFIYI